MYWECSRRECLHIMAILQTCTLYKFPQKNISIKGHLAEIFNVT